MVVSAYPWTEHPDQCPRQCAHKALPVRHNHSLSNECKVAMDAGFAVDQLSATDNRAYPSGSDLLFRRVCMHVSFMSRRLLNQPC